MVSQSSTLSEESLLGVYQVSIYKLSATLDGELKMKKTTSHKNKNQTKTTNRQNIKVDTQTPRILRTVGDPEAFHFYETVGRPTGETATSLTDFLDKMQSIKSESLMFHLQRKDFQNWIREILGDSKLARELGGISSSNSNEARKSIHRTVENRIKELKQPSMAVLVDDEPVAYLQAS